MRLHSIIACIPAMLGITIPLISRALADVGDIDDCVLAVQEIEEYVGVTAVFDEACRYDPDGLGCFDSTCRKCLFFTPTEETPNYYTCEELAAIKDRNCSAKVSPGDKAVGISAQADLGCSEFGGIGCFPPENNTDCRFCATTLTSQSQHLVLCEDVTMNITNTTSSRWAGDEEAVCDDLVSSGDADNGISAYFDEECLMRGGLGCIDSMASAGCRYCKTEETSASQHLYSCDRQYNASAVIFERDECGVQVSLYGNSVGVSAEVDDFCEEVPSTGCFKGAGNATNKTLNCRYCHVRQTHHSSHLYRCHDQDTYETFCTANVPDGDLAVGINAYLDAACEDGGVGCFSEGNCRFCRSGDVNDFNSNLVECPTQCEDYLGSVSYYDAHFIIDERCLDSNGEDLLGCQPDTSCRLCKTYLTQGADLHFCANLDGINDPSSESEEFDFMVSKTQLSGADSGSNSSNGTLYWALGAIFVMALIVAVFALAAYKNKRREPEVNTPVELSFESKLDSVNNGARI